MLDEFFRDFGNVNESVLMYADIDERTEVDDVAHDAVQDHADGKVGDVENVGMKLGHGERVAHVASRLFKLRDDVDDGGLADGKLLRELGNAVNISRLAQALQAGNADIVLRIAEFADEERGLFVGFGVDARVVENFLGSCNAKEARALLVRFRADAGNLQDLGALLNSPFSSRYLTMFFAEVALMPAICSSRE